MHILLLTLAALWTPASADDALHAELGRTIYDRHCSTCHGRDGDGDGPAARFLRQRPRDFTTGAYKFRSTQSGYAPTDADLARTVLRGVPGTAMPAWEGTLDEDDVTHVVAFIRTFGPEPDDSDDILEVPTPPAPGPDALRDGRAVFLLMQCWKCHGYDGRGHGPAADTLVDDEDRPIDAANFASGRFRSGGTAADIFRTLSTGVDGTPMPSYADSLLFGREAFATPPDFVADLDPADQEAIRAFVDGLPTSDDLYAQPYEAQVGHSEQLRWDLTHYVLSLSEGGAAWKWLWSDPYLTR